MAALHRRADSRHRDLRRNEQASSGNTVRNSVHRPAMGKEPSDVRCWDLPVLDRGGSDRFSECRPLARQHSVHGIRDSHRNLLTAGATSSLVRTSSRATWCTASPSRAATRPRDVWDVFRRLLPRAKQHGARGPQGRGASTAGSFACAGYSTTTASQAGTSTTTRSMWVAPRLPERTTPMRSTVRRLLPPRLPQQYLCQCPRKQWCCGQELRRDVWWHRR